MPPDTLDSRSLPVSACSVMGYEDLNVVDPTAGEAQSGKEASISEVRRRRRRQGRRVLPPAYTLPT